MSDCYCDQYHDKCAICEEAEQQAEENLIVSGWNWNNSPRECADEAKELGWRRYTLKTAMERFGYNQSLIDQVLWEFELGE